MPPAGSLPIAPIAFMCSIKRSAFIAGGDCGQTAGAIIASAASVRSARKRQLRTFIGGKSLISGGACKVSKLRAGLAGVVGAVSELALVIGAVELALRFR